MKTNLLGFLLLSIFLLNACSSSDKTDYNLYDNSVLTGDYKGTCRIQITNSNLYNTDVSLENTDNTKILVLRTTEFGNVLNGEKLTNFRHTNDFSAYTFDMGAITSENLTGGQIKEYIHDSFGENIIIQKASIYLNKTHGLYSRDTKKLQFTYRGTIRIEGIQKEEDGTERNLTGSYSISYFYDVIKQN